MNKMAENRRLIRRKNDGDEGASLSCFCKKILETKMQRAKGRECVSACIHE